MSGGGPRQLEAGEGTDHPAVDEVALAQLAQIERARLIGLPERMSTSAVADSMMVAPSRAMSKVPRSRLKASESAPLCSLSSAGTSADAQAPSVSAQQQ